MKFFHLSDLHIGKQLHHYNLREDQEHILADKIYLNRANRDILEDFEIVILIVLIQIFCLLVGRYA